MKAIPSRVILLNEREFWDKYNPLVTSIENAPKALEEQIWVELQRLDKNLKSNLAKRWNNKPARNQTLGVDYEVADDWNICWHHCMGIYSERIHCSEFLNTVQSALAAMPHDWCFHVACECRPIGDGQIFFYRGKVYGDNSAGLDYSRFDSSRRVRSPLLERFMRLINRSKP